MCEVEDGEVLSFKKRGYERYIKAVYSSATAVVVDGFNLWFKVREILQ